MVLSYAFCNVSVMPMRSEPSHRSEQVNQMLFGERAEILELNEKDWARIRCEWDGYEGWCRLGQLTPVPFKSYRKAPKYISANHSGLLRFEEGDLWLPMGAELYSMSRSRITLHEKEGKFKGKRAKITALQLMPENLKAAALKYLHAPYLWGGRTVAGIDCSGLVQMAFRLCGMAVQRDASQQAKEGEGVDFLQHAHCGDLAFFDNDEGKIVHVGILLDHQTIIHATETSGRVVKDRIDNGGIISVQLKRRTHNLRFVKRLIV